MELLGGQDCRALRAKLPGSSDSEWEFECRWPGLGNESFRVGTIVPPWNNLGYELENWTASPGCVSSHGFVSSSHESPPYHSSHVYHRPRTESSLRLPRPPMPGRAAGSGPSRCYHDAPGRRFQFDVVFTGKLRFKLLIWKSV